MHIFTAGINHHTAPVAIREKIAIGTSQLSEALLTLRPRVPHSVILSTCNRTEIYSVNGETDTAFREEMEFLKNRLDMPYNDPLQWVYTLKDQAALEHLFRVISGLESMVVGEYEILGQVRQSLAAAEKAEMVDLPLRYLFNSAIRLGRQVRAVTGISKNAVSVSSAAVDLATGVTGDLKKCRVLIIGTGEAGQMAARVARERGVTQIAVVSRNKERALAVAGILNCRPLGLDNLADELALTDIVITCSGAPHRILRVEQVEKAIRKRPNVPLVIIDIAMPRNVDPEVKQIPNVFAYNMDDLNAICEANRKLRENAIHQAESIIRIEMDKFNEQWHHFETRPIIRALMSKAEEIRLAQLKKTLKKLPPLTDEQQSNLEAMTRSIVTKILQDPIEYLKIDGNNGRGMIQKMFKLDLEDHT